MLEFSDHQSIGRKSVAIKCEITSPEAVRSVAQRVVDEFGRINIVITYAGINIPTRAEDESYDDWKSIIDVNMTGVFLT